MDLKNAVLGSILVLLLSVSAEGDVAKDKEKCTNQLVGLATCLPYVGGDAKAPTKDCCTGFRQVLRDSRECVCILIKDRDDPSLGLKINATLALSLPAKCDAPLNQSVTDCPSILHLPPNSPEAKVFQEFANTGNKTKSPAAVPATASSSATNSTGADQKSDGGVKRRWLGTQMVSWVLLAMAALHIFIDL